MTQKVALPTNSLTCDLGIQHTSCNTLAADERKELIKQVKSGDLNELEFDAIAFVAKYPNSNYLRFYDKDLPALATSFGGQPFLRNHDVRDIGSRDGTILTGEMIGKELHQRVRLTTERGMLDFLQGRIDRFSIGWYFDDIDCSICESRWMECNHWPGHHYKGPGKDDPEQTCELIFVNPSGKETSAVNAPAVKGTRVLGEQGADDLASLIQAKEQYLKGEANRLEEAVPPVAATPPVAEQSTPSDPEPDPSQLAPPENTQEEPQMDTTETQDPELTNAAPSVAHVVIPEPVTIPVTTAPTTGYVGLNVSNPTSTLTVATAPAQNRDNMVIIPPATQVAPAPIAPQLDAQTQVWMAAMRETAITGMLANSGLPPAAQNVVRLAVGDATDPARVQQLIEAQRQAYATQLDAQIVHGIKPTQGASRINGMTSDMDKFKTALYALLNNERPASGLKPLSGIKEAYVLASGDWEMTGRFKGESAQLANITSSALPDMMAEWMNQKVVTIWQSYDQWYRQFCDIQNFSSLRDPHWIKIGGIGELSTVGEGAAYTEKEWIAESETTGWTKKGNWIGVTIEALDRDMTGYVQQLPKALVQGAWLTISKDFTRRLKATNGAGYGYQMQSDSKALFHADHHNLGNSALSWLSWEATRLAMARQTDLGTGEVLGGLTLPATIMIPRHLENTAIEILATERSLGNGNNNVNPLAMRGEGIQQRIDAARKMLVVNDFLGTSNDWFAFADQQRFPLFGLGFRWGESPEIFSVADPTSGMMFTNDVMPVKIRWYYSLGAIDYKGMYYQKVG